MLEIVLYCREDVRVNISVCRTGEMSTLVVEEEEEMRSSEFANLLGPSTTCANKVRRLSGTLIISSHFGIPFGSPVDFS